MPIIYKISDAALWRTAEQAGAFHGAPVDLADGYIHFSTAAQVKETAARVARNPQTKEEVQVPAGKKARFKPGKALKETLN